MNKFIINSQDSLLLVIDIQEKLFKVMEENIQGILKKNTEILMKTAKEFNIPVIITEQYRKGLGTTIPELANICSCPNLEKTFFNCMKDETIAKELKAAGKKNILIAGIESHICVLQTTLSLLNDGYNVIVACDAVASRRKSDWQAAMKVLEKAGAVIYPTETIAFMILEKSGTEQFKRLSSLFK